MPWNPGEGYKGCPIVWKLSTQMTRKMGTVLLFCLKREYSI